MASLPGAPEAASTMSELFPLGQRAKASRRGRKRIGTQHPVQDFDRLLAEGGWVGLPAGGAGQGGAGA